MKLSLKHIKAMTLFEMIIASGIGVTLVAGAVYFGMRFTQMTKKDEMITNMMTDMKRAADFISKDLSEAIRIKGSSNLAPAVFRTQSIYDSNPESNLPAQAPRGSSKRDRLQIFAVHAKEFSAPLFDITAMTICPEPRTPRSGDFKRPFREEGGSGNLLASPGICYSAKMPVNLVDLVDPATSGAPETIHQWNAQRFINQALKSTNLLLAFNSKFSFLIEIIDYTEPSTSSTGAYNDPNNGAIVFKVLLKDSEVDAFVDLDFLRISAVKSISYYYEDGGKLTRNFKTFAHLENSSNTQTLLEKVYRFNIDWGFADRRSLDSGAALDVDGELVPLNLPSEYLSGPFYELEPDLSWMDISSARIRLVLYSYPVPSADQFEIGNPLCWWHNPSATQTSLMCELIEVASLVDFEEVLLGTIGETASSYETCLVGDKQNRCKPECDAMFVSSDSSRPDWEGYRSGSDYCKCKGTAVGGLLPGEPGYSWPNYVAADANNPNGRLNACIRAFAKNCSHSLKNKDPRLKVACDCVHNTQDLVSFTNEKIDVWPPDETSGKWADIKSSLLEIGATSQTDPFVGTLGGASPHFNAWMPPAPHDAAAKSIKCHDGSSACIQPIKTWLNPSESSWVTSNNVAQVAASKHPIHRYCGCLTYEPDAAGKPNKNGRVNSFNNLNRYRGRYTPSICPNLFESPTSTWTAPTRVSEGGNNVIPETYEQTSVTYAVAERIPNADCDLHCRPTRQALIRTRDPLCVQSGNSCTGQNIYTDWYAQSPLDAIYKECKAISPQPPGNDFRAIAETRPPGYQDFWSGVTLDPKEASIESIRMILQTKKLDQSGYEVVNYACAPSVAAVDKGHNSCASWWWLPESWRWNLLALSTPDWSGSAPQWDSFNVGFDWTGLTLSPAPPYSSSLPPPSPATQAPTSPENSLKELWSAYCHSNCPTNCSNILENSKNCANLRTAIYLTRLARAPLGSGLVNIAGSRVPDSTSHIQNLCYGSSCSCHCCWCKNTTASGGLCSSSPGGGGSGNPGG